MYTPTNTLTHPYGQYPFTSTLTFLSSYTHDLCINTHSLMHNHTPLHTYLHNVQCLFLIFLAPCTSTRNITISWKCSNHMAVVRWTKTSKVNYWTDEKINQWIRKYPNKHKNHWKLFTILRAERLIIIREITKWASLKINDVKKKIKVSKKKQTNTI